MWLTTTEAPTGQAHTGANARCHRQNCTQKFRTTDLGSDMHTPHVSCGTKLGKNTCIHPMHARPPAKKLLGEDPAAVERVQVRTILSLRMRLFCSAATASDNERRTTAPLVRWKNKIKQHGTRGAGLRLTRTRSPCSGPRSAAAACP